MVMGLVGLYYVPAFVLVLAVLVLPFYGPDSGVVERLGSYPADLGKGREFPRSASGAAVALAAILIVCTMMVILAPSILFDPLAFHLPLAQNYVAHASLTTSGVRPLWLQPAGRRDADGRWGWRSRVSPARRSFRRSSSFWPCWPCTASAGACRLERAPCFVGCVLGASVPFIHVTGIAMKNDLAVAFFQLTGLLTFLYWQRDGEFRWIQLGVFLAALSLWCKLPAPSAWRDWARCSSMPPTSRFTASAHSPPVR